jgi:type VI protein secretion system component Hcp
MELLSRKGGTSPVVFQRYCFQNVQVTSIKHTGSGGDDGPHENVSFYYTAVSEQYSRQNADGSIAQTVFAGWNATTGALITAYPTSCG